MKKWIGILLAISMLFALAACGSQQDASGSAEDDALIVDYGTSELYTPSELEDAANVVIEQFDDWGWGTLLRLKYDGDEANNQENIEWLNQHEAADPAHPFTQCAKFVSDFHTNPGADQGGFNTDADYTDWQWFLGRSEGGDWVLVDMGY